MKKILVKIFFLLPLPPLSFLCLAALGMQGSDTRLALYSEATYPELRFAHFETGPLHIAQTVLQLIL